jgi:signal transduction histidine kinase
LDGGRFTEELRTPDGRSIEVTAGAVAALASQPAGRFVSLRDRSEQRQSERLLQQRQKLESVGIMAAGVAHEVNNPLAYVRSNLVHLQELSATLAERLKETPEITSDAELEEFPEILDESVAGLDRIATIVRGMLRFTRPSSEEAKSMDINVLVEDALQLAQLQGDRRILVERRLAEGLPTLEGSAQGIVQVLLNIRHNARLAVSGQNVGRVHAQTQRVGNAVEFLVEDNGPGIDEADLARIFDPFFTTRAPGKGTGLGLSIAFDIVRNHGGTLEYSPADMGGARFSVRLEVPQEAASAVAG